MEDKENLSEHEKKMIDYEKKMKEKVLNQKKLYEKGLEDIKIQTQRLHNLPRVEQREFQNNLIYWSTTGVCYFFIGMFLIRRPKRFWKRLAVWSPTWIIYQWFVINHYFWSVKDKVEADKTIPVQKEISAADEGENNKIEH